MEYTQKNWTSNDELGSLTDELEEIIQKINDIGETKFALCLQTLQLLRILDGDNSEKVYIDEMYDKFKVTRSAILSKL